MALTFCSSSIAATRIVIGLVILSTIQDKSLEDSLVKCEFLLSPKPMAMSRNIIIICEITTVVISHVSLLYYCTFRKILQRRMVSRC